MRGLDRYREQPKEYKYHDPYEQIKDLESQLKRKLDEDEIGQDVHLEGGALEDAVNEGVYEFICLVKCAFFFIIEKFIFRQVI